MEKLDFRLQQLRDCNGTNRITSAKSLRELFARIPTSDTNGIHWGAFFSKLSQLQTRTLDPLFVKGLASRLDKLDTSSFTAGQLGQIAKGHGQSGLDNPLFVQQIITQSVLQIDDFNKSKELHMLLTGLKQSATKEQIKPLLETLALKFTTAQYRDGASPATLVAWINTCITFRHDYQSIAQPLKTAEERINEFGEPEIGTLLNSLEALPRQDVPNSLLQACETQLLSLKGVAPRTWASCLPSFGRVGHSSPKLVDRALKECSTHWNPWDVIGVLFGAKLMNIRDLDAKSLALDRAQYPSALRETWAIDRIRFLEALLFQLDPLEYGLAHPLIGDLQGRVTELRPTDARHLQDAVQRTGYKN